MALWMHRQHSVGQLIDAFFPRERFLILYKQLLFMKLKPLQRLPVLMGALAVASRALADMLAFGLRQWTHSFRGDADSQHTSLNMFPLTDQRARANQGIGTNLRV